MEKRLTMFLVSLLLCVGSALAQTKVSGTVLSQEDGQPIIGAAVKVVGTSTGLLTDVNGRFTVTLPAGKTQLEITYLGMEPQTVTAKNGMRVFMKTDTKVVDEVIVVAFGTTKKSAFTGSATVMGSEELSKKTAANVANALVGSVPGLQMTQQSGAPGADSGNMFVRGITSMESSVDPLIIVDGAPYYSSLTNINTDDIESVTVLKDAASAALYGAAGAAGVILVTTKKGEGGGRAQVSFDTRIGWNSVGQFAMSNMTKASDIYEFAWKSIYNSYRYGVDGTGNPKVGADGIPYTNFSNPNHTHEEAALFASQHLFNYMNSETSFSRNTLRNALVYDVPGMNLEFTGTGTSRSATMIGAYLVNPDGKINPEAKYFLQKENEYSSLFSNAFRQEYNVSIRGGNEKLNYFVSLGYDEDPSYIPTSAFNRYTGRAAINAQPLKWLKIGTNIGYTRTKTNEMATRYGRNPGSAGGNVFRYVNGTSNLIPIYMLDENHNYVYDASGNKLENITNGTETYSPLGPTVGNAFGKGVMNEFAHNKNETIRSIWTSRSYAQVLFTKDLNFLVNFNYDSDDTDYNRYRAAGTYNGGTNGGLNQTLTNRFILNTQQMLNYSHDFGDHHVDAMAGHEWNDDTYNSLLYVSGYELIPDWISAGNFIGRYTNGGTTLSGSPGWTQNILRMESYFGRLNYNYAEKYYLSGSLREDGSSKFVNDRWGLFGSVGAGWVISKERFMDSTNNWLDLLKIRSSWGVLGNQNGIGTYGNHTWTYKAQAYQETTNGTGIPDGYMLTSGGLVNEQLTWEKTQEFDLGLDFGFLNHRINGAIDFYDHKTLNGFYNADYSVLAGSGSPSLQQNAAVLRNRGFELEFSIDLVRTKDVTFNFTTNGTHYRTVLLDVPDENIPDNTGLDLPMGAWQAKVAAFSASGTGAVDATTVGYLRGEGRDWYNIYLYKYAGVDKESGLPMYWHRVTEKDITKDENGNYDHNGRYSSYQLGDNVKTLVSSDASLYEIGSATPDWIGGFTFNFRFKNFDASAQFAYQVGGKFFSTEYGNGIYRSGNVTVTSEMPSTDLIGKTFGEGNTDAYFPIQWWNATYYDGATFGSWKYTDMALFNASYVKCKNISIGYSVPKSLLSKINMSSLRFYASADNLFYVSAKKGVDPSMSILGGFEVGQYVYPNMRTFSLGLNINF